MLRSVPNYRNAFVRLQRKVLALADASGLSVLGQASHSQPTGEHLARVSHNWNINGNGKQS